MPGARPSLEKREEIALGIVAGDSLAAIGQRLGRPTSTFAREGPRRYRATRAQRRADHRARRPKPHKLIANRPLAAEVARWLTKKHSTEQIANRLCPEHADEPRWWVSHETIYQSLYLQARGGLRAELTEALRTGRARRRPKGANPGRDTRGRLKGCGADLRAAGRGR